MVESHHTSYEDDETVDLCRGCHNDVHKDEDDPLYPEDPENSPYRDDFRPEIDAERGDNLHEGVKSYAQSNGITMPRAYRDLLEKGLENETNDT